MIKEGLLGPWHYSLGRRHGRCGPSGVVVTDVWLTLACALTLLIRAGRRSPPRCAQGFEPDCFAAHPWLPLSPCPAQEPHSFPSPLHCPAAFLRGEGGASVSLNQGASPEANEGFIEPYLEGLKTLSGFLCFVLYCFFTFQLMSVEKWDIIHRMKGEEEAVGGDM